MYPADDEDDEYEDEGREEKGEIPLLEAAPLKLLLLP